MLTDAQKLERQAVCSTLREELETFLRLCGTSKDIGPVNNSRHKIDALCHRLDQFAESEKAA